MKKLILPAVASLLVLSIMAAAHPKAITGWVVDEKCGAKAANAGAADCTKKCIEGGSKPVFVSDANKEVLKIDNPESIKEHYGHHVSVQGTVDNGVVHIDSVEMASAETGKPAEAAHEHGDHEKK
jgi:hypothetical protein